MSDQCLNGIRFYDRIIVEQPGVVETMLQHIAQAHIISTGKAQILVRPDQHEWCFCLNALCIARIACGELQRFGSWWSAQMSEFVIGRNFYCYFSPGPGIQFLPAVIGRIILHDNDLHTRSISPQ